MSIFNKVLDTLQESRRKNIGQNRNIKFLVKDFDYDADGANEVVDRTVACNAIKIVSFNGRKSSRAVSEETQDGNTTLGSDTQCEIEKIIISVGRDEDPTIMNEIFVGKLAEKVTVISRTLNEDSSVFLKSLSNAF